MLLKKGSGGNHVIVSNTALVVSIAHRVYWRQD